MLTPGMLDDLPLEDQSKLYDLQNKTFLDQTDVKLVDFDLHSVTTSQDQAMADHNTSIVKNSVHVSEVREDDHS